MRIPDKINNDFFTGQRGELIEFVINDTVLVTSGNHEGKECAVISIKDIKPEVTYLLEDLDGTGDILAQQNELKLLVPSEVGRK